MVCRRNPHVQLPLPPRTHLGDVKVGFEALWPLPRGSLLVIGGYDLTYLGSEVMRSEYNAMGLGCQSRVNG